MVSNTSRFLLVLAVFLFVIRPVAAQSIYAAGSLGADIVFASGQESNGFTFPTGGGESISGAARVGVLLEPRWGIELEVSRAGEIRETFQPNIAYGFVGARPAVAPETEHRTRMTTVSGCLDRSDESFRLKDTSGADAPKARSWKSGFLRKSAASIDVVDATHRLRLANHVGQRVSLTGTLEDRSMQARSLQRIAGSCK